MTRAARVWLLGAGASLCLSACSGERRPPALTARDLEPAPGTARVEIESADDDHVAVYPVTGVTLGEKLCLTPCTVFVPPGPVALSAIDSTFQARVPPHGLRVRVVRASGTAEAFTYVFGFLGASGLTLALVGLPATDFGNGFGATETGVVTSAGLGLGFAGLAVGVALAWARTRFETQPLARPAAQR